MKLFFQNAKNQAVDLKDYELHSDFKSWQWVVLAVLWVVIFPVCIPLWLIWKLFVGTFVFSGMLTFWLAQMVFKGIPDKGKPFRWQCVRAYINNCIGMRLPHWNWRFRKFLFRLSGITIGKNGFIGMSGYMEDYLPENVVIEDNVTISFGVTFIAHGVKRGLDNSQKRIVIRKGSYIGAASVLLPGIEIGRDVVVGAGSVVTKSVPAGAVVAGSPAKILRYKPGFEPTELNEKSALGKV